MTFLTPEMIRVATGAAIQLRGLDLEIDTEYGYQFLLDGYENPRKGSDPEEFQHDVIRAMIKAHNQSKWEEDAKSIDYFPVDAWAEELGIDAGVAQRILKNSFFVEDLLPNIYNFVKGDLESELSNSVPKLVNQIREGAMIDAQISSYRETA